MYIIINYTQNTRFSSNMQLLGSVFGSLCNNLIIIYRMLTILPTILKLFLLVIILPNIYCVLT